MIKDNDGAQITPQPASAVPELIELFQRTVPWESGETKTGK